MDKAAKMAMEDKKSFVTDQETEKLIRNIMDNCPERTATEDDLAGLVRWANKARITAVLVDMAIKGEVMRSPPLKDGAPLVNAKED